MARKASPPKTTAPAVVTLDNFLEVLAGHLAIAQTNPELLPGYGPTVGNPITLGPRVRSAAEWAQLQVDGSQARGEVWLARTLSPKKDPLAAAIKAKGKWASKLQEAITQDRFAKGVARADEDIMMATIRAGGAAAYTGGVAKRLAKITKVVADLQPRVLALTATLDAMPIDTDAQREAKMLAAKRGMQAIGKARLG